MSVLVSTILCIGAAAGSSLQHVLGDRPRPLFLPAEKEMREQKASERYRESYGSTRRMYQQGL